MGFGGSKREGPAPEQDEIDRYRVRPENDDPSQWKGAAAHREATDKALLATKERREKTENFG